MTNFRFGAMRAERTTHPDSESLPSVKWRHTRDPSVGSSPSRFSAVSGKTRSFAFQIMLCFSLALYIVLPSRTLKHITNKASSATRSSQKAIASLSASLSDATSNVFAPDIGKLNKQGVAIVAACMNRQETLRMILPTWLAVEGVDEVVIVDWNSDPPLKPIVQPENDPRIHLYRVEDEPSWVLSRAYNLAINRTERQFVIRTDCDYALDTKMLSAHNLSETDTGFYSGNWNLARNENEVHLNGAMIMKRDVFLSVGGYDERIQTYGWDDEDLYTRLSSYNISKLNVSYDHVSHVSHGDSSRQQTGVKFAQVQIDLNSLLLEKLPLWSRNDSHGATSSKYEILGDDGNGYVQLKAHHIPESLQKLVPAETFDESWAIALGRRLADDYHVPWDVLGALEPNHKETLLRSLMKLQAELDAGMVGDGRENEEDAEERPKNARMLLVHTMHGLGNRLRALGSALAFAKSTNRVPVIIWESDAHIAADFEALFNTTSQKLIVMKTFGPQWPFDELHKWDKAWNHFQFYNYMEMEEGAKKGELIVNDPEKHMYYKGAYIMESPQHSSWDAENEQLRLLQPVDDVEEKLKRLEEKSLSSAIGVHIRNRTLGADIKNVDFNAEYGSEAAETMEHWRMQSSYRTFTVEMQRIIDSEDPNARFYVATDTWEVIALMEKQFPGRILFTRRTCDDRDSECVKFAVVDVFALSRTKKLLGSNWSSYTELAERLSGLKAQLAGEDFGKKEQQPVAMVETESTESDQSQQRQDNGTQPHKAEAPAPTKLLRDSGRE